MIGSRALKKISIEAASEITITVRGGLIEDIKNIPEGTIIQVQDYDVENLSVQEVETLPKDHEGRPFTTSLWENTL